MGNRMVRSAGTPLAPGRLEDLPEPTWASMLGRGLPQFMGEAVAPVLVFFGVWKAAGLGAAIAASTVVYLALAVLLLRRGRDVALIAIGACSSSSRRSSVSPRTAQPCISRSPLC